MLICSLLCFRVSRRAIHNTNHLCRVIVQSSRNQPLRSSGMGLLRGVFCLLISLLFSLSALLANAQQATRTFKVATRIVPPFVMIQNEKLTGFSIDLWNAILTEMGATGHYQTEANVKDLLATVKSGKADLGIAAISITADREKEFDFSQPIYESGLQIMVTTKDSGQNSFLGLMKHVFTPSMLQLTGIMLLIMLIPAHVIWLLERKRENGLVEQQPYVPGIFKAMWWAMATLATQADEMPRGYGGRILAVIWMFVGVVFVALFTANITTNLTVQELQGNIKGPDDLPGKKVATTAGSTSARYLGAINAQVTTVSNINDAYDALKNGTADAVVFDAPVLLYYASHEGKGKVQVVGSVFHKENYGIVFPNNSPYRKEINQALLKVRENGTYDDLENKWFSSNTGG